MKRLNEDLDNLLRAYRDATPVPDPSAHFMPSLWEKIDGRRVFTVRLKKLSHVFVGSAALICLLISGVLILPQSANWQNHATYLDVLADAHPTENLLAQGIAHSDIPEVNH